MAKKVSFLILFILSALVFSGCGSSKQTQSQPGIKVVSTTAMIDEVVKAVGGDKIQTEILIKGDIDPHSYELVKGDQAKLRAASLIFYQGLGLEHGASLVTYLKSNSKAYAVGEVYSHEGSDLIYYDGILDPHIWLDVSLWKKIVPFVKDKLIELDPQNRAYYEENALQLIQNMDAMDQKIETLLSSIPEDKKYLVTSHSAFSYFTRRYVAKEGDWMSRHMAPEGLAPEAQISLYDIERVVDYIRTNGIQTIFSESNVSKEALQKILDVCQKSGLKVALAAKPLFGDAFFDEKGYLDMMWHNATLLHQAWHHETSNTTDP